jgi:hypothetical protein
MAQSDVYDFRDELWKNVFALAKRNGLFVAKALRQASRDVWNAGIDALGAN